ncbi:MAG: Ni/Fe hydrogenase subunit alpha [Thermodesulfobacteriota bacterium]
MEVSTIRIKVNQLTRVEGHGNLIVKASQGKLEELRWEITESPRFFELMLRGRPWHDAHVLASRICGICSVSHQLASIQATEAAFGIQPSGQTILLRRLLYVGEIIESHILHLYFLALPDFLNAQSTFSLMKSHQDTVLCGARLKKLGNDIMEIIGGRAVHPQAAVVNGFGRLPTKRALLNLRDSLEQSLPDLQATVDLFKGFELPDFSRETEYISLRNPEEYAFIRGSICSTDTGTAGLKDYLEITNEYCVPHSTAKLARHVRSSYAVGALARINNNFSQLHPLAKDAAAELSLQPMCFNPFMNHMAQVVETIHEMEEGIEVIEDLLRVGIQDEQISVTPRAGRGIGAVEAPRGLLIHDYSYGEDGHITGANCVIPTGQNHGNIQEDLEELVSDRLDKNEDELRLLCEMLIRAYDPCISCSTH